MDKYGMIDDVLMKMMQHPIMLRICSQYMERGSTTQRETFADNGFIVLPYEVMCNEG